MEVPADFRSDLKTMINSFIWSTKKKDIDQSSRAHTQMARMCQKPDKGGCKFLDLDSQINAFGTRWIQRLIDPTNAYWKDFVWDKIDNKLQGETNT